MVTIIGAGISGLSLAYHLQKANIEYTLLEASAEVGGYIKTMEKDGCLLELGPNSILCDQELLEFLKTLGLEEEILNSNSVSKSRFIFKNGQYRNLPENPLKLLFGNFFSASTKFKILREPFAPLEEKENETLQDFFDRRFGSEITEYALNPFITGIYAGDPKQILLEETFPSLKGYERKYGSVLRGIIKNKPVRKQSLSFKGGMQSLPKALAKKLNNLLYNTKLKSLKKTNNGWILEVENNNNVSEIQSDMVVVTTPSFVIQPILKSIYPEFSNALEKIYYPPMCAVHSVYEKASVGHSLNGFGGLNPKIENQFTSGSIWSSSVFDHRCPNDKVLFTSFIGGSLNIEKTQLKEEEIKEQVHIELKKNFNISQEPYLQNIFKWSRSIPQYTKDLKIVKELIPALEKDQIFFCTNWINGVSLSDCIKKGKQLADKISNLPLRKPE